MNYVPTPTQFAKQFPIYQFLAPNRHARRMQRAKIGRSDGLTKTVSWMDDGTKLRAHHTKRNKARLVTKQSRRINRKAA